MHFPHPSKIVSVGEMQAIERAADAAGHSYAAMMERAGEAVADVLSDRVDHSHTGALILVGPGNNGGDGLVCARHFQNSRVYVWKRATAPDHDYQGHYAALVEQGTEIAHADDDPDFAILGRWLTECGVVVDALLGTGSNRPITGQLADLLDVVGEFQAMAAQSACQVVAVDCPSGLNCDTGALDPHALPADVTVTFAHAKHGHFRFPGADAVGELIVADIGTDPALSAEVSTAVLDAAWVADHLPARPNRSHKGTYGKVMAAVGSINYPGAAFLSCAAAARVGAGLVTAAVAQPVWTPLAARLSEVTFVILPSDMGVISANGAKVLRQNLPGYDALLLGCGLTQEDPARDFVRGVLAGAQAKAKSFVPFAAGRKEDPGSPQSWPPALAAPMPPTVIDADGLNCLAKIEDWPDLLPDQCVLTPHPAEMARLCGLDVADVTADPWTLARQKAAEWGAVILLKGPFTAIAEPGGVLAVLPIATSALATAGTGDVLAGAIAGLMAQGLSPFEAACVGAWIHGQAGLLCAEAIGPAATLAGDVLAHLGPVLRELSQSPNLFLSQSPEIERGRERLHFHRRG